MKILIRKTRLLLIIAVIVVSSVSGLFIPQISSTVYALGCDDDSYGENNIDFYSPEGCDNVCSNVSSTALVGSGNIPTETAEYLESVVAINQKIEANKARYLYAEEQTGIMWQSIAALHFREAGLDSSKSIVNGSNLGSGLDEATGVTISSDPNEDAKMAAENFEEIATGTYQVSPSGLTKSSPGSEWGKAFLAYHAGPTFREAAKDYTLSTYVVNGIDQNTLNMSWLGGDLEEETGVDDKKAGALTILKFLEGINDSSGCSGYGAVTGDIVTSGINLALPTPAPNGTIKNTDARPSYLEAFSAVNGRVPTGIQVTDCGRFVSVVMRSSKVDSEFPEAGTDAQVNYMRSSPRYIEVTNQELEPGDILVYNSGVRGDGDYTGHIMIYTGANGTYVAVDASLGQRVPSVREQSNIEWMRQRVNYSAWRLNG